MASASWRAALLWCGLVLYILSFGLKAVDDMRGWQRAVVAFGLPGRFLLPTPYIPEGTAVVLVGLLVSGWINPVFLTFVVQMVRGRHRSASTLRIAVLLMVGSCWFVFGAFGLHPREGFVVWVTGMVLVLSSFHVPRLSDTGDSAS